VALQGGDDTDTDAVLAGWSIAGLGVALVAATVVAWWRLDADTFDAFDAFVVTLPAVATVAVWPLVRRASVPTDLYPGVFRTTLAGAAVLGGIVLAAVLFKGDPVVPAVPLLLFITGVGSAAGGLVGMNRAQNVHQRRQAEALREERERLRFLHHLLRHNVLNKANVIQGKASLAAGASKVDPEALDTIHAQSEDMVDFVESIRVLVTAATTESPLRPVDLSSDLRAEVESSRTAYEDAAIDAAAPDGLVVHADDLLRYVFENLVSNAVEHHDGDEAHVEVTAERDGHEVVVTVADDGPGIPDDRKETVFEPDIDENHGLGLYLVRTLVDRYGGDVNVSDADPRGTAVTVRLRSAR
jgi:signal transduction histidine kinase